MGNIIKNTVARNAAANAITGKLDASTGGSIYPTGHLSIYTADATRITWHVLSNPSFGSAIDGTATANQIYDATGYMNGTASSFAFEGRDGSSVWHGLVSLVGHGGALQLESLVIPKDSTIGITSAKYIVPA